MNFHDNSKNENLKNQKIDFSFVSAYSSSFMKTRGGLHILSLDIASNMKSVNTLTVYSNIIYINSHTCCKREGARAKVKVLERSWRYDCWLLVLIPRYLKLCLQCSGLCIKQVCHRIENHVPSITSIAIFLISFYLNLIKLLLMMTHKMKQLLLCAHCEELD